jgi:hypothetical protein
MSPARAGLRVTPRGAGKVVRCGPGGAVIGNCPRDRRCPVRGIAGCGATSGRRAVAAARGPAFGDCRGQNGAVKAHAMPCVEDLAQWTDQLLTAAETAGALRGGAAGDCGRVSKGLAASAGQPVAIAAIAGAERAKDDHAVSPVEATCPLCGSAGGGCKTRRDWLGGETTDHWPVSTAGENSPVSRQRLPDPDGLSGADATTNGGLPRPWGRSEPDCDGRENRARNVGRGPDSPGPPASLCRARHPWCCRRSADHRLRGAGQGREERDCSCRFPNWWPWREQPRREAEGVRGGWGRVRAREVPVRDHDAALRGGSGRRASPRPRYPAPRRRRQSGARGRAATKEGARFACPLFVVFGQGGVKPLLVRLWLLVASVSPFSAPGCPEPRRSARRSARHPCAGCPTRSTSTGRSRWCCPAGCG